MTPLQDLTLQVRFIIDGRNCLWKVLIYQKDENQPMKINQWKSTNENQPIKINQWKSTNENQPIKINQWEPTNENQPMTIKQWKSRNEKRKYLKWCFVLFCFISHKNIALKFNVLNTRCFNLRDLEGIDSLQQIQMF